MVGEPEQKAKNERLEAVIRVGMARGEEAKMEGQSKSRSGRRKKDQASTVKSLAQSSPSVPGLRT